MHFQGDLGNEEGAGVWGRRAEGHTAVPILVSFDPDAVEEEIEYNYIHLTAPTLVRIKRCLCEKVNQDKVRSRGRAINSTASRPHEEYQAPNVSGLPRKQPRVA